MTACLLCIHGFGIEYSAHTGVRPKYVLPHHHHTRIPPCLLPPLRHSTPTYQPIPTSSPTRPHQHPTLSNPAPISKPRTPLPFLLSSPSQLPQYFAQSARLPTLLSEPNTPQVFFCTLYGV